MTPEASPAQPNGSAPKICQKFILALGLKHPAAVREDLIDVFLYKPVKAEELKSCLAKLLQRD